MQALFLLMPARILQTKARVFDDVSEVAVIRLWFFIAMSSIAFECGAADFSQDGESSKLPMKIGNTVVVRGNMTQRTAVVMDDTGTVYILSINGGSDTSLFRISRRGAAKDLIMYRGWPYILSKQGGLFALNASWMAALRNKLPYMSIRFLKTIPLAVGTGAAAYAIGLIDSTFIGFVTASEFHGATAFFGGIGAFYGFDVAHTIIFRSHRSIGDGGNFFSDQIAKRVADVLPDEHYDDFVVVSKGKAAVKTPLSQLVPRYIRGKSCMEYLTRLNLR